MKAELDRQDVLANNIANSATTGFKRKIPTFNETLASQQASADSGFQTSQIPVRPLAPAALSVVDEGVVYTATTYRGGAGNFDPSSGSIRFSGQPFDLALEGEGYFTLEGPEGNSVYTRNGSFRKDTEGYLATAQGYRVLGEQGTIMVEGADVSVTPDGIVVVDGEERGRLLVQIIGNLDTTAQIEGGIFRANGALPVPNASIKQGFLETSNVNAVSEMVAMISSFRAYEAAQRMITNEDNLLGKAVNEIGRV